MDEDDPVGANPNGGVDPSAPGAPFGWSVIDTAAAGEPTVDEAGAIEHDEGVLAEPPPEEPPGSAPALHPVEEALDFERLLRAVEPRVPAVEPEPEREPEPVAEWEVEPEREPEPVAEWEVEPEPAPVDADDALPEEIFVAEQPPAVAEDDVLPEELEPPEVGPEQEPEQVAIEGTAAQPASPSDATVESARLGDVAPAPRARKRQPPQRAHRARSHLRDSDRALVRVRSAIGLLVVVVFSGVALAAAIGLAMAAIAFAIQRAVGG